MRLLRGCCGAGNAEFACNQLAFVREARRIEWNNNFCTEVSHSITLCLLSGEVVALGILDCIRNRQVIETDSVPDTQPIQMEFQHHIQIL